MNSTGQFNKILDQMGQEVQFIESNRAERNKRYSQCMSAFKEFLSKETEQFQTSKVANNANKQLISKAFQNTFERVLASSDVSIRKIKQTYNQKKIFWDNVIKMNSGVNDIELKKQFYVQKRNAQDGYLQAIDRQKDKHKNYKSLVSNNQRKEHLRQYQQNNKVFEEKVVQGTNTLQQWQNVSNTNKFAPYSYVPEGKTVINQFINRNYQNPFSSGDVNPIRYDYGGNQSENSTLFINNFQIKK